ncbi:MAG: hypothetical protein FGM15_11390 [Chthoniobacterales bacterium]|nr:hypothetical protein [Chthoniobacterales bacterium]
MSLYFHENVAALARRQTLTSPGSIHGEHATSIGGFFRLRQTRKNFRFVLQNDERNVTDNRMRNLIAATLAGVFALGACWSAKADTYFYSGDPVAGSLTEGSPDWNDTAGRSGSLESSTATILTVDPEESMRLEISVAQQFTTAGRLVVGDAERLWNDHNQVVWTGFGPLTLERSDGQPGEFLLEAPRTRRLEGVIVSKGEYVSTGTVCYVPLLAPKGLVFGGAGYGPERSPEHVNDFHRLTIAGGLEAEGPCTKIGPSEAVLYGAVKIGGLLHVQEGNLVLASTPLGSEQSHLEIESMRVDPDARFAFSAPPDAPPVELTVPLGQPGGDPIIACDGTLAGIKSASLDLLTSDRQPPTPGRYRLVQNNGHIPSVEEFAGVTLNGSSLPDSCQMDYSADGRSIDLLVSNE